MEDITFQQKQLRRERNDLAKKKGNLFKAVEEGLPFAQVKERLSEIERRIKEIELAEPRLLLQMPEFDVDYVRSRVDVLKSELAQGGEDTRNLIKQFVISVTWFPDKQEHEIEYAFVSPRGGAGSGSRTLSRTIRVGNVTRRMENPPQ
jgi:hypothetical protein